MNMKPIMAFFGFLFVMASLLHPLAASQQSPTPQFQLQVDGLACPFCAYGIEKNLMTIDEIEKIEINIQQGTIRIWTKGGSLLEEEKVKQAIQDSGFTFREFKKIQRPENE